MLSSGAANSRSSMHREAYSVEDESIAHLAQTLPPVRSGYLRVSQIDVQPHPGLMQDDSSSGQLAATKEQRYESEVHGWPVRPQTLRKSIAWRFLLAFVDIVLLLFPLLFLALAVAALVLNGQSTLHNGFGSNVEEASKIGPTVFPIIFAAIISRALKSIGRLSAERGIRLETLQNLLASSSIFNAFANPLLLQQITVISILLMTLWSLSPIGGQAALRVVFRANETTSSQIPLRYLDTGPAGIAYTGEITIVGLDGEISPSNELVYGATLFQTDKTKLGSEDAWGNVKVPRIESLDAATADRDGWIPFTSPASQVESYSSLLGIPVVNIPQTGQVGFTFESSYVSLSCAPLESNVTYNATNSGKLNILCNDCPGSSLKSVSISSTSTVEDDRVRCLLGVNFTDCSTNSSELFSQTIDIYSYSPVGWVHGACSVTETHVETMVNCTTGLCGATAVRHSTTDHRPANVTAFDYWGTAALVGINGASLGSIDFSSPSEFFLNDSSTLPFSQSVNGVAVFVDLSTVSPDVLAARASMILNTGLQLVISSTAFGLNLSAEKALYYGPNYTTPATVLSPNDDPWNSTAWVPDGSGVPLWLANVTAPFVGALSIATLSQTSEVYRADYAWVVMLFVSSAVVLVVGLVGAILERLTVAPDLFDPVAGWTYNNRYLGIPETGTALDRLERVRLLKGLAVRVGDVHPQDENGKIGLGAKETTGNLKEERLYA